MGEARKTLEKWTRHEQLRLRTSLRRVPAVAKSGAKRTARAHPVATGAGAAALLAAVAVGGVWLVARARRDARPTRVALVKRGGPSPLARVGKIALKALPSVFFAAAGLGEREPAPLARVARHRRSPWSAGADARSQGVPAGAPPPVGAADRAAGPTR